MLCAKSLLAVCSTIATASERAASKTTCCGGGALNARHMTQSSEWCTGNGASSPTATSLTSPDAVHTRMVDCGLTNGAAMAQVSVNRNPASTKRARLWLLRNKAKADMDALSLRQARGIRCGCPDGYGLLGISYILCSAAVFLVQVLVLMTECWRRLNLDHLCRLNFDQGLLLAA